MTNPKPSKIRGETYREAAKIVRSMLNRRMPDYDTEDVPAFLENIAEDNDRRLKEETDK